ncbi:MAG: S1/P1 nuclease [Candidatus Wallbacteria bacterium]|nr:S1/P1 nuclease [Candidatus Wallbacteria bacterium]
MIKKITLFALIFWVSSGFSYGFKSHYQITESALRNLSASLPGLCRNHEKISFLSALVDDVKKVRADEYPRHFLDFENFPDLGMGLPSKEEFYKKYSREFITKNGNLPYAIEDEYAALVDCLKRKDYQSAQQHLGFLSHYCGDLFQPLHMTNYFDGYNRKQRGIHSAFESGLADALWPRVDQRELPGIERITDLHGKIFDLMMKNRSYIKDILIKESLYGKDRLRYPGPDFGSGDIRLMGFCEELLHESVIFLSSVIFSAVQDAGSSLPQGTGFDLTAALRSSYDEPYLKKICETSNTLINGIHIHAAHPEYLADLFKSRSMRESASFVPDSDSVLESNLAELFCDGLRDRYLKGNGIALYNVRGFREWFQPGMILLGDLKLCMMENDLAVVKLTGSEIIAILVKAMNNPKVSGGAFQQSGLKVVYSKDKGGYFVKEAFYEGQKINPDHLFFVVTNSFLAHGGDGYSEFRNTSRTDLKACNDLEFFVEYFHGKNLNQKIDGRNTLE